MARVAYFRKKTKVLKQYQLRSVQNIMHRELRSVRRETAHQRTHSRNGKTAHHEEQTIKYLPDRAWLPANFPRISLKGQNLEEAN
jgi:hypothetical protein